MKRNRISEMLILNKLFNHYEFFFFLLGYKLLHQSFQQFYILALPLKDNLICLNSIDICLMICFRL